jgi:drug/metabolite transporter (DMT)-like permease
MKKNTVLTYVVLHLMLMIYSMSGICSKMASRQAFLSPKFILYYGLVIVLLGFYAIAWQQIIKRLPLTTAYANRAVTVIWGAVWGLIIFHEEIHLNKMIGILLVVAGVALYALSDGGDDVKKSSSSPEEKEEVQ